MKKAYEDPNFMPNRPEEYDWNELDSYHLNEACAAIAANIKMEIQTTSPGKDRIFTAGLRKALVIISEIASI